MRSGLVLIVLATSVGVLAACGNDGASQVPPQASHPVATSAAPGGKPRSEAILKDPQQRPAGLPEQLEIPVAGGGDPCPPTDEPRLWTDLEDEDFAPERAAARVDVRAPIDMQIPGSVGICVGGMNPGRPGTVTLTAPSGKVVRTTAVTPASDSSPKVYQQFLPGAEVGTYTVTARQDGRTATRKINVRRASKLGVFLINRDPENWQMERDGLGRLKFAFGGLPPGKPTAFYLYHSPQDNTLRFHSTYQVTGDANGEAFLDLVVTDQTPLGAYLMVRDPARLHTSGAFGAFWHLG
ncbi:hypothetical protein ACFQ07_33995 [Actinomadura adrarensis]|uniref:Bacterial Ig domain-containing protein n=1 Tax=Actinomadura adrarensis TaxID=1819600 RepID=A0ABW3CUY0_9ACTN